MGYWDAPSPGMYAAGGASLMRLNAGTIRSTDCGAVEVPSGITTVAVAMLTPGGTRIGTVAMPSAPERNGPKRWPDTSMSTLTLAMPVLTCQGMLPTSGMVKKPTAVSGWDASVTETTATLGAISPTGGVYRAWYLPPPRPWTFWTEPALALTCRFRSSRGPPSGPDTVNTSEELGSRLSTICAGLASKAKRATLDGLRTSTNSFSAALVPTLTLARSVAWRIWELSGAV